MSDGADAAAGYESGSGSGSDDLFSAARKRPKLFFGSLEAAVNKSTTEEKLIKNVKNDSETITLSAKSMAFPPPAQSHNSTSQLSSISQSEFSAHNSLLAGLESKARFRTVIVPVEVSDVKKWLRLFGDPVTLFGESPGDRRERLRGLMAARPEATEKIAKQLEENEQNQIKPEIKEYSEPGPDSLLSARLFISSEFTRLSAFRHEFDKNYLADKSFTGDLLLRSQAIRVREVNQLTNMHSQRADERPISAAAFDSTGDYLATSSWSGTSSLWKFPQSSDSNAAAKKIASLAGHEFKISDIQINSSQSNSSKPLIASCGLDSQVLVYSPELNRLELDQQPMDDGGAEIVQPAIPDVQPVFRYLNPTYDRFSRLSFHPSGLYLFASGWDCGFHFFDLTRGEKIYQQTGHAYPTYGIACHSEGNLLAVGDLGAVGMVWDIRFGKPIWRLIGHAKKITCLDWHANGFLLASGSEDHTIKIWDIRNKRLLYTIPAHDHLVSNIQWSPDLNSFHYSAATESLKEKFPALPTINRTATNSFLLSSSFDRTVKVWDGYSFQCRRSFPQHTDKVTRAIWRPSNVNNPSHQNSFISTSFDRTLNIFKQPTPELSK